MMLALSASQKDWARFCSMHRKFTLVDCNGTSYHGPWFIGSVQKIAPWLDPAAFLPPLGSQKNTKQKPREGQCQFNASSVL